MSLQTDAAAAVAVFPFVNMQTPYGLLSLPVLMLAMGGRESGWNDTENGDCGLGGPAYGTCPDGSCCGTSWGWLQYHNVHASDLVAWTGSSDPAVWASWLYNPVNCARAALTLIDPSNPDPKTNGIADGWATTYRGGYYAAHISQAIQAVDAAVQASRGPNGGTTSGGPFGGYALPVGIGLAAALFAGGLVGAHRAARRRTG